MHNEYVESNLVYIYIEHLSCELFDMSTSGSVLWNILWKLFGFNSRTIQLVSILCMFEFCFVKILL